MPMNKHFAVVFLLLASFSLSSEEYFFSSNSPESLNFKHDNGNSHEFYYPEIVGSGVALFDADQDGDLDVYLVQSGSWNANKKTDKLYINNLAESGKIAFKESTQFSSQHNNSNYGIGIATADVNNDGYPDFYLTNLHKNKLFINQKGKGFKLLNIDEQPKWSTSASFCDINKDGFEDLYVSNYVDWSIKNNPKCFNASSKRDYCGPDSFAGLSDSFYLNVKGEKFIDKTLEYFPKMAKSPGLNVACEDMNNDGWPDFIVANDGKANLLWLNQSGKSFKEFALFSGLAVNAQGVAEASMGMALSDYDIDGDMDIFFTHLMNETNTLYRNNGKGYFQDVTNRTRLSKGGFSYTGWAARFLMVNNDIYPDLLVFNGAVASESSQAMALEQANQLYLNSATSQFQTITNEPWLKDKRVSRGAAFGDIDNDGDSDIVINNNNARAQILYNNLNPEKWLGLSFGGNLSTIDKIVLSNPRQKFQIKYKTDGSYASAHDPRIVLNQAQLETFDAINISLVNGNTLLLKVSELPLNHYSKVKLK